MYVYVCLHICVWTASGILSLLSLPGCLSSTFFVFLFSLFYLLPLFYRVRVESCVCLGFYFISLFAFIGKSAYFLRFSRAEVRFDSRNDSHCGRNVLKRSRFSLGCWGHWRNWGGGVWTCWKRKHFWRLERSSCFFISSVIICSDVNGISWLLEEEGCEIL